MAADIFRKQLTLKPSAMATVAERRFDDAVALYETRQNARANGVAYLAGFVIEILLKARLVERFPATARKRQHEVAASEREIWALIWRRHDLDAMLDQMPELEAALKKKSERAGKRYFDDLKVICATWTIQARYSPLTIRMIEAREMLERVRALKELLR
jgi:hypothetical protein